MVEIVFNGDVVMSFCWEELGVCCDKMSCMGLMVGFGGCWVEVVECVLLFIFSGFEWVFLVKYEFIIGLFYYF